MNKKWMSFLFVLVVLFAFSVGKYTNWNAKKDSITHKTEISDERVPSSMTDSTASLNSLILDITNKEDVLSVAAKIVARDAKINPVVGGKRMVSDQALRTYAIAARLVPLLEGAVYRFRNVAEKNFVIYASAITFLREISYNSSQSPQHYQALFDFLTKPNPEKEILGQVGPFKSLTEAQNFLSAKLAPEINLALFELDQLIKMGEANRVIMVLDPAVYLGDTQAKKIEDAQDGKINLNKIVLAGHLKKAVAVGKEFLGVIYYAGSFDLEGANDFSNKLTTQYYVASENRLFQKIAGIFNLADSIPSPKDRFKIFNSVRRKHDNFLKANAAAEDYLKKSWAAFQTSAKVDLEYHQFLLDVAGKLASPDSYIANADLFQEHEHHAMDLINKRNEIFSTRAPVQITNFITGEKTTVNVSTFFDLKNVSDLAFYFPQQYSSEPETSGRNHDKFEWNYNYGKPIGWNSPSFNGLFGSGATNENVRHNVINVQQYPPLNHLGALLSLFI